MKKIMIYSMILLPLILLLILSLNTIIVSKTTYVYVENVEIIDSDETIYLVKTYEDRLPEYQLEANIFPMLATNKDVVYSSENENIATVNSDGLVVGVDFGETFIKVEAKENKTKFSTRKVIVTADEVLDLKIENIVSNLFVGENFKLNCSVVPQDANNKTILYSSSNEDVATISMMGDINAKAQGKTIITIKSQDNDLIFKSFELEVRERLTNATIDGDTSKELLETNNAMFPKIILFPENAIVDIIYISSDTSIATVDETGHIEFLRNGSVDIEAIVDNEYTFKKTYQYTAGYVFDALIKGSNEFIFEDNIGKPCDLELVTRPKNIKYENLNVEISNEKVVVFGEDKKFYIKGGGVATITITYKLNEVETKVISKTINVIKKAQDIIIRALGGEETNVLYTSAKVYNVNSQIIPKDATYDISLSTLTEGVQIDHNNVVFPDCDYCKAVVTASTNDGALTKEFTIIYFNNRKIKLVQLLKGENNLNIDMPRAINEQELDLLFAVCYEGINSVVITDGVQELDVVKILDKGNYSYSVKVNGAEFATINISVSRKVESIENVKFVAHHDDIDETLEVKNNSIYTSAKEIDVNYNLYPLKTTLTKADISIVSGNAEVIDNKIIFKGIGNVEVNIKADEVDLSYNIFSTYKHPNKDTTFIESKVLNKGEKLLFSDIVTKINPAYIDENYISYSSVSSNLRQDGNGFFALCGGEAIIDIQVDSADGIITKQVNVKVLEEATSITLNKNYFVVDKSYEFSSRDFNILPTTANDKVNVKYTTTNLDAVISENKISYNGSGLVTVNISLENGVNANVDLLFKGRTDVIELGDNIVELELGKEFIAKVPEEVGKQYNGINNISGLTYDNGIFKISNVVKNEGDLESASFTIGNTKYSFKGVILPTNISIDAIDSNISDKTVKGYVTALDNVKLSAKVTNSDATYKGIKFVSNDESVATVDLEGNITFIKAGEVEITAYSEKVPNIKKAIVIRSTKGLAERVEINLSSVSLDYDLNNTIDVTDSLSVFPTTASKATNIKVEVSNNLASVIGFTIKALKGGSGFVTLSQKQIDGTYKNIKSIPINISRKATGILIDGTLLDVNKSTIINNGLVQLDLKSYPVDANVDTEISATIIKGSEFATISNGTIMFTAINEEVEIQFSLGSNIYPYTLIFSTSEVVAPVNVDEEIVVAPIENNVTFYSPQNKTFIVPQEFTKVEGKAGQYKAAKSTVSMIVVDGQEKKLVITERISSISDVTIEDFSKSSGQVETITLTNVRHVTASNRINIKVPVLTVYDRNGNLENIELGVDNEEIASVINGELVFTKPGDIVLQAKINGYDYYGAHVVTSKYKIASTMGMATDYTIDAPEKLVDTYSFSLNNKITINEPQYGTNNIHFTLSSNNILKVNNLDVEVLSTGVGELTIHSESELYNNNKTVYIQIDQSVKDMTFEENGQIISCDYIKTNTYTINTIIYGERFEPTLNTLAYELVSGNATINEGVVTIESDYDVVEVKVTAPSGISKNIKIIKVLSDTEIIDIKENRNIIVNNIDHYVFDIVGTEFSNLVEDNSNIQVLNAETGTIKFIHGGSFDYLIKGQNIHFIITENVDKVLVDSDNVLTAKSQINLDTLLKPTITPETAYTEEGAVNIQYKIISGDVTLKGNVLLFNNKSTAIIDVIANDKKATVTIESTYGYVKSITWNKANYTCYYSDVSFDIKTNDYSLLPVDVEDSKYSLAVEDTQIASVSGSTITLNKGGNTNIILRYEISNGVFNEVKSQLIVHNPINQVDFKYLGRVVDKIVVDQNILQLDYVIEDKLASNYTYEFIGDSIVIVSDTGRVTFKRYNEFSTVKIKITSSDGSVYEKAIKLMATDKKLLTISPQTVDGSEMMIEVDSNCLIYALPINGVVPTYQVVENADVLEIDIDGGVVIKKGGFSKVKVVVEGEYTKEIIIFVHKVTTNIVLDSAVLDNLYTARSTIALNPVIEPQDSNYKKAIEYEVNSAIASVQDNALVFKEAGEVDVTIKVLCQGYVECTKTVHIRSSIGKVESFDLKDENGTLLTNYIFENDNVSYLFTIKNVKPMDAMINYSILTNSNAVQITKNADNFIVKSIGRGTGLITVKIDNCNASINFDAKLKVKSISATLEGVELQSKNYITMQDSLDLVTVISPINANDSKLNIVVDNGGSYNIGTGKLLLPAAGNYSINITSNDGGTSFSFTIEKVDSFSLFELTYKNKTLASNIGTKQVINPVYNEPNLLLSFANLPSNFIGTINKDKVIITVPLDMKYIIQGNEIQLQIPAFTGANPTYKGIAKIQIGSQYIEVEVFRDGIRTIEFVDHDNKKDMEYGLQQMRVFGKTSYYNGNKNYYEMPIKITPEIPDVKPILTTSNNLVKAEYVNGVVRVNFGTFAGNSIEDVKNNIFDKTVTVTASDSSGTIKYSYKFHVVNDGVNVFDQNGYVNNGKVVLHNNLGGTEEEGLSKYSSYSYSSNSGKSLIYGNGFIINFYAYNATYDKSSGYDCVTTGVGTAINVNLKGTNFDASKTAYRNNFGGNYFAYTKIQQTYKGTYAGNGQIVKKCYFRYIKDMSIQISSSDRQVYVEDIISIDGGRAALECQKNSFYLKGFIDVYNFKNEDALKEFSSLMTSFQAKQIINSIKKMDGGIYINSEGDYNYANIVIYCGKELPTSKRTVFFYNGNDYVEANQGNEYAANGLVSISSAALPGGHVFTYPATGQFTWKHQNDFAYLARQEEKLWRTYDGRVIE